MYVGYRPTNAPITADQIKPLGDQMYRRLDGANMPLDIFKNALINGSFDFWQRGTSFSASGYGPDRWLYQATSGTMSCTQQAFAIGDIPSESRYFARFSITGQSAASDLAFFQQPIEGVRRFAGRRVVVRGMARRNAGSGNVAVEVQQYPGSGGSANVNTYAGTIALSTIWAPFSFVVNVPSLSGVTLGTASDALFINFWLSSGSNFNARTNNLGLQTITVDFADLEVKEVLSGYGDQFPGFERIPREIELLRCQRFYEQIDFKIIGNSYAAGALIAHNFPYRVLKRTAPSVTFSTPTYLGCSGLTQDTNSSLGFSVYATASSASGNVQVSASAYSNAEF